MKGRPAVRVSATGTSSRITESARAALVSLRTKALGFDVPVGAAAE
jgi:hypothetical protein